MKSIKEITLILIRGSELVGNVVLAQVLLVVFALDLGQRLHFGKQRGVHAFEGFVRDELPA